MKGIPLVSSKLLDKKWKSKDQEIHQRRLREVKSQVRQLQTAPFLPNHVLRNYKKDAMLETRYTEIERQNRLLLERMTSIMQNNKASLYGQGQSMKRSLNRESRKKDLLKITMENQAILKRLQDKTSNYSVTRWDEEFKNNEKIMKNMCEYPFMFDGDPNKTRMVGDGEDQGYNTESQADKSFLPRISSGMSQARNTTQSFSTIQGLNTTTASKMNKPLIKQAEALDENRIVLYKKGKQLGNGYYIVEISSNNASLFIAAYDVESPESLLIELPEKKAQDILEEFQNDYEKMASSLNVVNRRLVLLNPKYSQQKQRLGSAPAGLRPGAKVPKAGPSSGIIGDSKNQFSTLQNQKDGDSNEGTLNFQGNLQDHRDSL